MRQLYQSGRSAPTVIWPLRTRALAHFCVWVDAIEGDSRLNFYVTLVVTFQRHAGRLKSGDYVQKYDELSLWEQREEPPGKWPQLRDGLKVCSFFLLFSDDWSGIKWVIMISWASNMWVLMLYVASRNFQGRLSMSSCFEIMCCWYQAASSLSWWASHTVLSSFARLPFRPFPSKPHWCLLHYEDSFQLHCVRIPWTTCTILSETIFSVKFHAFPFVNNL